MMEKLRKKFILYTLLSIFILLFVLLSVINTINFSFVAKDADAVTQKLINSNGNFNNPPEDAQNPDSQRPEAQNTSDGGFMPGGPDSKETQASMRYFSYTIDSDGTIHELAYNVSEISEEEAQNIALSLKSNNGTGWIKSYYRYRVQKNGDNSTTVVVIDETRELRPSYRFLYISIIGTLVGLLVTFLILIPVSKKLIKPIEKSDEKQKNFIANAARELKIPITIMSANNILSKDVIDEDTFASNTKQVKKMQKLVADLDNLLIFDKMQKFEKENLDISKVASETLDSYEIPFKKKNIELIKEYDNELYFLSNENMLKKLFVEILDNGLKYSKTYFKINLKKIENRFVIETFNDCEELEDGDLDRVFEKFYRMQNGINSKVEGNGVGLSIVKSIVAVNDGRCSAKGKNGVFHLKIEL